MASADAQTADPSSALAARSADRGFWWAYAVCAAAALVPIWSVTYLPMNDLPQHAAQIFMWQHYDDPQYDFSRNLEFQWLNPYLLGYALWRLLACFLSIPVAAQVVVSLAVLALPCSLLYWLRCVGHTERWWALLGFPLAYGFSFYWGFLNFMLAGPLCWIGLGIGWRYAERPTGRRALAFLFTCVLLYATHGLMLPPVLAVTACLILTQAPTWRNALTRLWPLALIALPVGLFLILGWGSGAQGCYPTRTIWELGWERLPQLPNAMLGPVGDPVALAWVLGIVALGGFVLGPTRSVARWIPVAAFAGATLLAPSILLGTTQIPHRFASFVLPAALAGFRMKGGTRRVAWFRALLVVLVLAWLGLLAKRFTGFEDETRSFRTVLSELPPGRSVLPLYFERSSRSIPGVLYLNFAVWYEVEKGGRTAFSFMQYGRTLLRFRPDVPVPANAAIIWYPSDFSWQAYGGYDYYLVRAPRDLGRMLFRETDVPVVLVAQSGLWYLYKPVRAEPAKTPQR